MELYVIREEPTERIIKYKRIGNEVLLRCSVNDFEEIRKSVERANSKRRYQRNYLVSTGKYDDIKQRKLDIRFTEN